MKGSPPKGCLPSRAAGQTARQWRALPYTLYFQNAAPRKSAAQRRQVRPSDSAGVAKQSAARLQCDRSVVAASLPSAKKLTAKRRRAACKKAAMQLTAAWAAAWRAAAASEQEQAPPQGVRGQARANDLRSYRNCIIKKAISIFMLTAFV